MSTSSHGIDRIDATFDDPNLVANAGLIVPATLMARLGLEALVNSTVRLVGRVGGASPGRKICTLVATILAGGSHIDHANVLRAGATAKVLGFRVDDPVEPGHGLVLEAFEDAGCDPFVAASAQGRVGDFVVEDGFDVDPR